MPKRRKKNGAVTPLSADVTSVLRGMARGLDRAHPEIWASWPTIVGPDVARRAVPKSFSRATLVVAVESSTWLQELSYLKEQILDRLAEAVGPSVVKNIKLVLDPELRSSR
jgi:predicted nucleic acid-binding Zn ribbon protein